MREKLMLADELLKEEKLQAEEMLMDELATPVILCSHLHNKTIASIYIIINITTEALQLRRTSTSL